MANPKLNQLYFIAIDTPEVDHLPIQYTPETIDYEREANISEIAIIGRNNGLNQYVGGSTKLSFELMFFSTEAGRQDVKRKVKWLESQTYSGGDRPPSRLKIVFGDLFKDEIWVLQSVGASYSVFDLDNNAMPTYANVSLSFIRDTDIDLTASDIRNQNY